MSTKHSPPIEIETPVLRPGSDGQTFWMQSTPSVCISIYGEIRQARFFLKPFAQSLIRTARAPKHLCLV